MTVKILIKRKATEKQLEALTLLLRQFRVLAIEQPGYVSGETLKRIDQPDEVLVISTWESIDDWNKWVENPTRKSIQGQIDALLGIHTIWEVYGAG